MSQTEHETNMVETMLREVAEATPTLFYEADHDEDDIEVRLPYGCSIVGALEHDEGYPTLLYIEHFNVHDDLQGHGIGTRLLRSFTAEGKARGATYLYGNIGFPAALRVRAKVFGEENLIYYDQITHQELTLSFGEAMQKLEDDYLQVEVDLRLIDTTGWERPVFEEDNNDALITS